jgi:outer membrane protein assembly factor BamB
MARVVIDQALIPKGPVAHPSLRGCLVPALLAGAIVAFTVWRMTAISFAPFGAIAPLKEALRTSVSSRTRILQPGRLLASPGGDQLFVVVRNFEQSRYTDALARFDLATGTRAWEQPASYQSSFVADASRVYVTHKSRLVAYDREKGTALWEAALSDQVQATCDGCLGLVGARIVAHTADETLQMFDGATGRVVMSRELGRPNRVAVVGDRLLVVARDRKTSTVQAVVVDADGRDERTFPVRCPGEWGNNGALGWNDFAYADPATRTLVAWYQGGCVQRYDLSTGTLVSKASTSNAASIGSNAAVLAANGVLYLAEDENLHALAPGASRPVLVANVPDYSLRPVGASRSVVVLRARRRIGSTHFEIWGLDARTGVRLWQIKMGDGARPMEPPDEFVGILAPDRDDTAFAADVSGDRLRVVRAGGKGGPWVSVETVDLATGTSRGEKRVQVDAGDHWSAPRTLGWRANAVWLLVDGRATAIDLEAGTVLSRVP